MRSIVRDFTYVTCLLVIAFMFALAWRSPFVQASLAHAPAPVQTQPHQPGH
jgi:hypothetical protein